MRIGTIQRHAGMIDIKGSANSMATEPMRSKMSTCISTPANSSPLLGRLVAVRAPCFV